MKIPNGYTKEQVLDMIDGIVKSMAADFVFGCYDIDDIIQEGRIEALEGLDKFDLGRGTKLSTFLTRHITNRLKNLRRNKFRRANTHNEAKISLARAAPAYTKPRQDLYDAPSSLEQLSRTETFHTIEQQLPVDRRRDFICLVQGITIPQHRRAKLLIIIQEILDAKKRQAE